MTVTIELICTSMRIIKFDWTEDQFKELKVGTLTLDEVLDAHGKATDAEYSDAYEEDKPDLLDLTYRKETQMETTMFV